MTFDSFVTLEPEAVWSASERSRHMRTVLPHQDLSRRILSILADQRGLLMEQLLEQCPDSTWSQVFLEVDRMSRTGEIRLTISAPGEYRVDIQEAGSMLYPHK